MADAERFRAYSADLSTSADLAAATVRRIVAATEGMDDAEAYEFVRRNYPKAVRAYAVIAAERARAYYQAERDAAGLDQGYAATSGGGGDGAWYRQDVDEARRGGTGDHALVGMGGLAGRAVQRVMARADYTIGLNARRDPAHPKWAFVAHPGACGFCVMVASNGWGYSSEASAMAQRHENCKCSVAVDFSSDPSLDGYDPKGLQKLYAQAEEAVHDQVNQMWEAMSPEERARYKRKGRNAKDTFKTRMVTAEMDRRSGHKH